MEFNTESEFGFRPSNPSQYALSLLELVNRYQELFSISVVDFFTLGGFSKLPEDWQRVIPSDVVNEGASDAFIDDLIQAAGKGLPNLSNQDFRFRMSPKKQHEVGIMAALVGKVAAAHRVETVIDLGSGQGYLSRLLAFQHGLNVLGVDGDPAQSAGAYRIDAQFAKRSTRVPGELSHSTLLISPASLPQLQRDIVDFNGQKDWLLCGLHTCGSLAYTTIDLFFKTDANA
ncbi:hypothetical protein DSO57_1015185 [Entomophthora muscae]|uniref:Uncharacterized protein n=1 Tax=Entomophthora muscae TaxID=34485 RepID=A0ACC2S7B6_9FUNG|nr:hypothetical protein DSO57_1015185 [Entomophthora muscae]